MDQKKNLDCNQIKIFINLEIIGEEKLYIFFKSENLLKKILQFGEVTWHTQYIIQYISFIIQYIVCVYIYIYIYIESNIVIFLKYANMWNNLSDQQLHKKIFFFKKKGDKHGAFLKKPEIIIINKIRARIDGFSRFSVNRR